MNNGYNIPEKDNSNKDCLHLSMLSSAVTSSIIDSVSERVNNNKNFFVPWYSLSFGSISQTLQSCVIQYLV